jgi:Fuc2NAc and GlcNAc transferase
MRLRGGEVNIVPLVLIPVAACLATIGGTRAYRALAIRRGIVANPNFRSLHERPIPRGGGIVFACVCVTFVSAAAWLAPAGDGLIRALVIGGAVAAAFGFLDDVVHIRAAIKFGVQGLLAAWVLLCVGARPLVHVPFVPEAAELAMSWLGLVWLMNLYNFMDGIDGMAASGAVLISATAIVLAWVSVPDETLILILSLVALCSLGFLVFNWPPASIFMGDAGSLFLGLSFGAVIASTVSRGQIGMWSWLVMFGYFAGDTTTTTFLRILVTKKWYGEHRSHAYQNLARIRDSHLRVVRGVVLYHVVWLLPLALWSVLVPSAAAVAALLALGPVVVWTLRHGPLLSSS